ncbi:Protein tipD [Entamoeba marina]
MQPISIIHSKLQKRNSIQIDPWKSFCTITITSSDKEIYSSQIQQLSTDLHNATVFSNAQTTRMLDTANKISELETSVQQAEKIAKQREEELEIYVERNKDEDNEKEKFKNQIIYLKNELSHSHKQLVVESEKIKQVNYENHRLLDIIEDLSNQLQRSTSQFIHHPSPDIQTNQKLPTGLSPQLPSSDSIKKTFHSSQKSLPSQSSPSLHPSSPLISSSLNSSSICHIPTIAVRNITSHTGDVTCIAFNSTGQQYATGSEDRTVNIWNSSTSKSCGFLRGMSQSVTSLDFSPFSNHILVTSNDATTRVFDISRSTSQYTLTGHSNRVTGGKFTNKFQIVTASIDRTVKWWDLVKGRCSISIACGSSATSIDLYNEQVVTGHLDGSVRLWDSRQKESTGIIDVHEEQCSDVKYFEGNSGMNSCLISVSKDNTIQLIDPIMLKPFKKLYSDEFVNPGTRIGLSSDKQFLTVGSVDGAIFVWNMSSYKLASKVYPTVSLDQRLYQPCYCSTWNPLTSQLISGYGKQIIVWGE